MLIQSLLRVERIKACGSPALPCRNHAGLQHAVQIGIPIGAVPGGDHGMIPILETSTGESFVRERWSCPGAGALPGDFVGGAARAAHAICFGTLAQRDEPSRSTIQKLLSRAAPESLRVFDINLRQAFYSRAVIETSLGFANVLKLNEEELQVLAAMFGLNGDVAMQVSAIAQMFELRLVARAARSAVCSIMADAILPAGGECLRPGGRTRPRKSLQPAHPKPAHGRQSLRERRPTATHLVANPTTLRQFQSL